MTTYAQIDIKLDRILEEVSTLKIQAVQSIDAQKILADTTQKHDRVLYGVNGKDGVINEIGLLQQTVNELKAQHKENRATLIAVIFLFLGQLAQWFFN